MGGGVGIRSQVMDHMVVPLLHVLSHLGVKCFHFFSGPPKDLGEGFHGEGFHSVEMLDGHHGAYSFLFTTRTHLLSDSVFKVNTN